MKKLTCLTFAAMLGTAIGTTKNTRLVFQGHGGAGPEGNGGGGSGGHGGANTGETTPDHSKEELGYLNDFEKQQEATFDLNVSIGKEKFDEILASANKAIDDYKPKNQYENAADNQKVIAAINAAKASAKEKILAKYNTAISALEETSRGFAKEKSVVLTAASGDVGPRVDVIAESDEDIMKRVADANEKFGNDKMATTYFPYLGSSAKYVRGGEQVEESMTGTRYRNIMMEMIRGIYVAEGEKAATELYNKLAMFKGSTGKDITYDNMKGDKDFGFIYKALEHKPPLAIFDPDTDFGSKRTGQFFALIHAAESQFTDDVARDAYYKELLRLTEDYDLRPSHQDAAGDRFPSPSEWIKQHAEFKDGFKPDEKIVEQKKGEAVDAAIADFYTKNPEQKDKGTLNQQGLRAVLMENLKGKNDPTEWSSIIQSTLAKFAPPKAEKKEKKDADKKPDQGKEKTKEKKGKKGGRVGENDSPGGNRKGRTGGGTGGSGEKAPSDAPPKKLSRKGAKSVDASRGGKQKTADAPVAPAQKETDDGKPKVTEISGKRTWTGGGAYEDVDSNIIDAVGKALPLNRDNPVPDDVNAAIDKLRTNKLAYGTYEVDYGKKGKVNVTIDDDGVKIIRDNYKPRG